MPAAAWRDEHWSIRVLGFSRGLLTTDAVWLEGVLLFVGDDWAEDHHDVEVQGETGRTLKTARLPEGVDGMARFHELVTGLLPEDAEPSDVLVCIETDRGPWVRALVTVG